MAPCRFASLDGPAVRGLHALPRYLPPEELYRAPSGSGGRSGNFVPRPFSNHTFKFWDQGESPSSVGFTSVLFTFGVALVLLAVLCCCGVCASCCARCDGGCACSDARAPRRRRVAVTISSSDGQQKRQRCSFFCSLIATLHLLLLLLLTVSTAIPLFWGSADFAEGIDVLMSSYSTGASNFSHVDAALTQLTERVTLAQADATEL